jgi:uncharacterized protein
VTGTGAHEARAAWALFSDTHGNAGALRSALASDRFEAMAHCGDGLREAEALSRETGIRLHAVYGNEDAAGDYPETRTVTMLGVTAFLLHGHRLDLNPYQGPDRWKLHFASMEDIMARHGARLLFFGHTHVPLLMRVKRGIICNPGSMFPGSRVPHSFAVVESRDGALCVKLMECIDGAWKLREEALLDGRP